MDGFLSFSLRQLFGGARRGRPLMTGLGGVLTVLAVARRFSRPQRTLLYSRTLREGETIRLRLVRGGDVVADTEVAGAGAPGE
ncbi:MAG: hypothetical protein PVI35_06940 [Acidimicrobiia bacterium]|jgi:hypothetical protein